MDKKKEAAALAAKLLGSAAEDALENGIDLPELNAWYFCVAEKGGAALIVGDDLAVLYANSSVSFSRHIEEYKKGTRTPLELFEQ